MNKKIINYIFLAIFVILLVFYCVIFYRDGIIKNKDIILENKINIIKNIGNKEIDFKNNNVLKKNNKIKITIGGDIMLSRMVGYLNQKEGFDRITKKYNPITQTGGLLFFNLESPFSKFPKDGEGKSYYFGAHTGSVEVLNSLKLDNKIIVSLANNHIRNSLKEGINTTIKILNKNKILFNGIGIKKQKVSQISKIKINDNLICLQAFSYDGGNYGYVQVNKISKKTIKQSLDNMKKQNCDLNLISLHWGKEYKYEPSKNDIKLAHYIIDNGADIIIGHHSHIFGKTEIYKNKPIFYSLGNYIFDQDAIINNCSKYTSCIYDEKLKKKILPVNIGVAYELIFEKHKLISKMQKKHRIVHYGELEKY